MDTILKTVGSEQVLAAVVGVVVDVDVGDVSGDKRFSFGWRC